MSQVQRARARRRRASARASQKPGRRSRSVQPVAEVAVEQAPHAGSTSRSGRCTPLVTWPIGTVSHGRSGQSVRHSSRDTSPCCRDTPFTRRESRIAVTVMWNSRVRSSGMAPMPRNSLARRCPAPPRPGRRRPATCVRVEAVVPGGHRRVGGEDAAGPHLAPPPRRTACPPATSSRSRSTSMKAAWPSLACHAPGRSPPRAAPARRRRRGSTPAGAACPGRRRRACPMRSRSVGSFSSRLVSSR